MLLQFTPSRFRFCPRELLYIVSHHFDIHSVDYRLKRTKYTQICKYKESSLFDKVFRVRSGAWLCEWADRLWVRSFDQGICTYVRITLCTLTFSLLFPSPLYQGMALWLLTTLPFPIVFMLHGVWRHNPSYLAQKGEELRIQKTQTLTTECHVFSLEKVADNHMQSVNIKIILGRNHKKSNKVL